MRLRNKQSGIVILPPLLPLENARQYFDSVRRDWNQSHACSRLKAIIEPALSQCNKVVAFALGEFALEAQKGWHKRSAYQHAMLLTLGDALASHHADKDGSICYAQDPAYNDHDKRLFETYGVNVLDDPVGFLRVDDSTIVLSCAPNVPVRSIIVDIAKPVLLILDKPNPLIAGTLRYVSFKHRLTMSLTAFSTDPESPRMRDLLEIHYRAFDFSGDATLFGDLAIHIRQS